MNVADNVSTIAAPQLESWVGRQQVVSDLIAPVQVRQMAALMDDAVRLSDPASLPLPSGWHWLYFNPVELQSRIGADGHPPRGDFLPPVTLPRRMWAGSRLVWERAFMVGERVERRSEIRAVAHKPGRSGDMVFVTVAHRYLDAQGLVLTEEHDIVYREAPSAQERETLTQIGQRIAAGEHTFERRGDFVREICPDPVLLFRYSAATFNGHRIHYDADYCRDIEGYPGLVVHGPLIATYLLGVGENGHPAQSAPRFVREFGFRARNPTFALGRFHLHASADGPDALSLWSTDNLGRVAVDGRLVWG